MIKRYILPIAALAGFVFAVAYVIGASRTLPPPPPVAEPAQAPFESYLSGAGITEANTENIAVGASLAGIIQEVYVKAGQQINIGDPLFKIDEREAKAELAINQSSLSAAKARVREAQALSEDARRQLQMAEKLEDKRAISVEEMNRRRYAAKNSQARWQTAKGEAEAAEARINASKTTLDRLVVRTPIKGEVLKLNARPGEFAPAGAMTAPLVILGNLDPMYIRIDIDENDAWRFNSGEPAVAFFRSNRNFKANLAFVRREPFVVPKRSLTGESTERVDTRVLQVIYSFDPKQLPAYVGQQMDVFIRAPKVGN